MAVMAQAAGGGFPWEQLAVAMFAAGLVFLGWIAKRVAAHDAADRVLETKVDGLDKRMDGFDKRMDRMEGKIDKLLDAA